MQDLPKYPGAFMARLVTDTPTSYVLLGHTLAEVQAQLPPGLERSDPPEVVEVASSLNLFAHSSSRTPP
jgi:hypothetical protein